MKRKHSYSSREQTAKVACTVSAAALMLGVSQAATVGLHFQANYCAAASYSGAIVTGTAFGIPPAGWQNLTQMGTGYGCACGFTTLNQVIDTTTSSGGLNPLPNGSISVTWGGWAANVSGFGGYDRSGPHYNYGGNTYTPGNEEVYWGFIRDGVNFGPIEGTCGYSSGDNNQPGYSIDITGLKTLFTNSSYAVQLIASSDSLWTLTNSFIIDATANTTQSVIYPNIPTPSDAGGSLPGGGSFQRGIGGGLSTGSGSVNSDHLKIIGNRAQHTASFNRASTICGFIITDKPVLTMPPQPLLVSSGDTVVWSGYAVGVPPLNYQWRKNGVAIPGATTSSFGITNISSADNAKYDLTVANAYGSVVSDALSPDHLSITTSNNYVVDTNPNNPPLDGQAFGATWAATVGSRSGVMSFNAAHADQVIVPPSTNLSSSVGSISFWARSSGLRDPSGSPATLFNWGTKNGLVVAQTSTGQIEVQAQPSADLDFTSSSGPLTDGNWHHIVVTFDQATSGLVTLYVDGNPDSSDNNFSQWTWPTSEPLRFGSSATTNVWQAFNGSLDDIRVYNRTLTPVEVLAIFATSAIVDANALVLRQNFDAAPVKGVTLTWQSPTAILQSADTVSGPYTDAFYASPGYSTSFRTVRKYYRYRDTHAPAVVISNPYLM